MPPWSFEQPAAPLPGFQGTRAQPPVSDSGLGDSGLNPRWDKNPILPREKREDSEGPFQRGGEGGFARSRNESPHRLGFLASSPVFVFRPAIFFVVVLNIRDSIQEIQLLETGSSACSRSARRRRPFPQPTLCEPHTPVSRIPENSLGVSFSPRRMGSPLLKSFLGFRRSPDPHPAPLPVPRPSPTLLGLLLPPSVRPEGNFMLKPS